MKFLPVFTTTLFLSLNFGALLYVNSTFLSGFLGSNAASLIFLIAAIANILLFFAAPRLLNFFGKENLLFLFMLLTALGALELALGAGAASVAVAFIIYESFIFMAYYCLDIFVEEKSEDKHTGKIRGIYYTVVNAGIAAGPLLLSLLAEDDELKRLFVAAAVLLVVPVIFSLWFLARSKGKTVYEHTPIGLPIKLWWRGRNVRAVTLAKLALETFFALMVIYTPIYLHAHIGFEWSELGIIFTVMLTPFVLLEWPAGELSDRRWGEKEMMSVGLFLMGTALIMMPFLGKAFALWLLILLLSRVGAALVEITTESYFFKKIDATDTGLLAIFRLMRPMGIVFGALIGAVSLNLLSFEKIFFIAAIIVFFGLRESLYLKDTL